MAETKRSKRMVELITLYTADFSRLVHRQAIEECKAVQKLKIRFFITCLDGRVSGKYETLFHLIEITMFSIDMECSGQGVRLIQMPNVWVHAQLIEKFRPTNSQQDILSNTSENIGIIKAMRNRTRHVIVFINIGRQ